MDTSASKEDASAILSNMQYKEKVLWKKRMYLMGLSESEMYDEKDESHDARCENLEESFLRKDDVFYEELKATVERSFGGLNADAGQDIIQDDSDDVQFRDFRHMSRVILGLLDDLSNKGLYRLAMIFTEGLVIRKKTRPQMKRLIKERLPILQSKQCLTDQGKIQGRVSKLVKNQGYFRQNHVKHFGASLKSHRGEITKYLAGLKKMPFITVNAMHNKLKGVCGYMPKLCPKRSWSRDRLVDSVDTLCREMMDQLSETDKLQEPLAKAMDIAVLSSKLASNYQDLSLVKFVHVTPELEALRDEIFKAIQSLSESTKPKHMKKLQKLLDPKNEMGKTPFPKMAIKNMMTEFLYECSDMETIPDCLVEALSIINNTSFNPSRFSSKTLIEDEVECVLNVGANIKEILWGHTDHNLDQHFADAYMEGLTESDDGDMLADDDDDDYFYANHDAVKQFADTLHEDQVRLNINDLNEEVGESIGDVDHEYHHRSQEVDVKNTDKHPSASSVATEQCHNVNETHCVEEIDKNRYVALQEVSDQASMVAYRLIGNMMDQFGRMEALPNHSGSKQSEETSVKSMGKGVTQKILSRAVGEVMPSFPMSELEKVEKYMRS